MKQVKGDTRKNAIKEVISEQGRSKQKTKAGRVTNHPIKRLYNLKEAAYYLGRSVFSVRTLIWNGALPFIKDGRKQYIDIYDMDAYIEKNKETMI